MIFTNYYKSLGNMIEKSATAFNSCVLKAREFSRVRLVLTTTIVIALHWSRFLTTKLYCVHGRWIESPRVEVNIKGLARTDT